MASFLGAPSASGSAIGAKKGAGKAGAADPTCVTKTARPVPAWNEDLSDGDESRFTMRAPDTD
eukprot:15461915-Alexandrium_andersonii.AAC.1